MRIVVIIGVFLMAVVLFAGTAWLSSNYLTHYVDEKKKGEHPEASAQDSGKEKELPPLAKGDGASRSRPGSGGPDSEQLAQEFAKLRERQETLAKQEQLLTRRQRNLEIIKEDVRGEREEIDKVRKEITEQVKGVGDDMATVERRAEEAKNKLEADKELIENGKRGVYEANVVRAGGSKRVGAAFDTGEPADVAAIFEKMVESGDLMTVAQILANMKDRRAAAVLGAFQDKATAAQVVEKMVGLKQAASPAAPSGRPARPAVPTDGGGTH